jgi:hypothetical protein
VKLALFILFFMAAFGGFSLVVLADDTQENPCTPIFLACEDQGYTYDKVASPGLKLWADCANLIINKNEPVRGMGPVDPLRLKACQNYEHARDHYEKNWALHHPEAKN